MGISFLLIVNLSQTNSVKSHLREIESHLLMKSGHLLNHDTLISNIAIHLSGAQHTNY